MHYPVRIDSTNKTILLAGDIHQDIDKLAKIVEKEKPDMVVTTGDWFDSFVYNSEYYTRKTAITLLSNVNNPDFISCLGNHDVHYLWPNPQLKCSGYTDHKNNVIYNVLRNNLVKVRDNMKWYVWVDDYFVSHAGINFSKLNPMLVNLDRDHIDKWMKVQIDKNNTALASGGEDWFTQAGYARGGSVPYGGLVWQDFDVEFRPIEGLKQIVGHTPHKIVIADKGYAGSFSASPNLDIDCYLNQYIIVRDKALTIKNYADI